MLALLNIRRYENIFINFVSQSSKDLLQLVLIEFSFLLELRLDVKTKQNFFHPQLTFFDLLLFHE